MDMEITDVTLTTADGPMRLYSCVPEGGAPRAVIVIQEAFGVNDHIEDVTRRFADAGYHAVAPALFHRAGGGTAPYDDFEKVLPLFEGLTDPGILMDVGAALSHLREQGFDDGAIGIVGFCMGGRVTFLASLEHALGAAVGFYGGGIVTGRFPQFPPLIERVGELKTPWLGLFGDLDGSIPVEDVETPALAARRARRPDRGAALRHRRPRLPLRRAAELQRRGRHRCLGAHAGLVRGAPRLMGAGIGGRSTTSSSSGSVGSTCSSWPPRRPRVATSTCRPKGHDSLRVLDPSTVAYLDLTGSGAETIAHTRENGRITMMFCAFEGPPQILRLFGQGEAHPLGSARFEELSPGSPRSPGPARSSPSPSSGCRRRAATPSRSWTTGTSGPPSSSGPSARATTGCAEYWAEKNVASIDGLPALDPQ